jgi:hypothetical protein
MPVHLEMSLTLWRPGTFASGRFGERECGTNWCAVTYGLEKRKRAQ